MMESRLRNKIAMLSYKSRVFAAPQHDRSIKLGASVTYCRLRSLFRIPVVYADSPSATKIIEERMAAQKSHPQIMVTESDIYAYLSNETGRDRLKAMFSRSESGRYSTEITYIIQAMFNSCGMAFLMASIFTGLRARDEFRIRHQSTVFKTRFRAQRLMNDNIVIAVAKDGGKWAVRIAAFLFPFLMVSQSISVYRNKSSPFEYAAGSAVAGFFVKLNLGLKGGLAGSVIGGAMGLLTGALIYGLLYASDELQESRHYRRVQALLEEQKEIDVMLGRTKLEGKNGQPVANPAV